MHISGGDTITKRANFCSVPPTRRDKKYICPLQREGPKYVFIFRHSYVPASLKDVKWRGGGEPMWMNTDGVRWRGRICIRRTSTNVKKYLGLKREIFLRYEDTSSPLSPSPYVHKRPGRISIYLSELTSVSLL